MGKAIKHNVEINIQTLCGIKVWDDKRDTSSVRSSRKLNKINAIVSFSRNKKTESTGYSLPLQPSGNQSNDNSSVDYKAKWERNKTILLETNLHPKKKNQIAAAPTAYEPKHLQVVVGLQRNDDFIILGTSLLTVNGSIDYADIKLKLKHPNMKGNKQYFNDDSNRGFSLAPDAHVLAQISISSPTKYYQAKIQSMSENVARNSISNNPKHNITVRPSSRNSARPLEKGSPAALSPNNRSKSYGSSPAVFRSGSAYPTQQGFQHPHNKAISRSYSTAQGSAGRNQQQPMNQMQMMQQVQQAPPSNHGYDNSMYNEFDKMYDGWVNQGSMQHDGMGIGPHHLSPSHRDGSFGYDRIHDKTVDIQQRQQRKQFNQSRGRTRGARMTSPWNDGRKSRERPTTAGSRVTIDTIDSRGDLRNRSVSRNRSSSRNRQSNDYRGQERPKTRERSGSRGRNTSRSKSRNERDDDEYSHYSKRPQTPMKKEAPKNSLEAFGNLIEALGNVAKMGTKKDSSDEDASASTYDEEDDDEDESSSDESSLPTLPDKIKIGRKGLEVNEELTVNSYALSLAARKQDEARRGQRRRNQMPVVESREDADTYQNYYDCS